jgi:hypothetical protein
MTDFMPFPKASAVPEFDLPAQAAGQQPIINSPFEKPKFRWNFGRIGNAIKTAGSRKASYFWTTWKVMSEQNQLALEGMESEYVSEGLGLVNVSAKMCAAGGPPV